MEKLNKKKSLVENLYSIIETYTPKLGVYDLAKFEGYFEKVDSAVTEKRIGNKFEVSLIIREQDVINEYTRFLHGRDIITITEGFKVINEILKSHDVVINYSILSRENHIDPTQCVGSDTEIKTCGDVFDKPSLNEKDSENVYSSTLETLVTISQDV